MSKEDEILEQLAEMLRGKPALIDKLNQCLQATPATPPPPPFERVLKDRWPGKPGGGGLKQHRIIVHYGEKRKAELSDSVFLFMINNVAEAANKAQEWGLTGAGTAPEEQE